MLRFYFVRHGQTQSNIEHVLQGWSDTPLTSLGIQQGKQAHERMKTIPFLAMYASPSKRAMDTARYLCGNHGYIQPLEGLKEMNFGDMEGADENFGDCHTSQDRIRYDWHRFHGETLEDVSIRLKQTMDRLVSIHSHQEGNLLCVSHGFSILAAVHAIDENAFARCLAEHNYIKNCAMTIITWDNGTYAIETINQPTI